MDRDKVGFMRGNQTLEWASELFPAGHSICQRSLQRTEGCVGVRVTCPEPNHSSRLFLFLPPAPSTPSPPALLKTSSPRVTERPPEEKSPGLGSPWKCALTDRTQRRGCSRNPTFVY